MDKCRNFKHDPSLDDEWSTTNSEDDEQLMENLNLLDFEDDDREHRKSDILFDNFVSSK